VVGRVVFVYVLVVYVVDVVVVDVAAVVVLVVLIAEPPRTARTESTLPPVVRVLPPPKSMNHTLPSKPGAVVDDQYQGQFVRLQDVRMQLQLVTVQPAMHPVLKAADTAGMKFSEFTMLSS